MKRKLIRDSSGRYHDPHTGKFVPSPAPRRKRIPEYRPPTKKEIRKIRMDRKVEAVKRVYPKLPKTRIREMIRKGQVVFKAPKPLGMSKGYWSGRFRRAAMSYGMTLDEYRRALEVGEVESP